jgi:hypothetical protein
MHRIPRNAKMIADSDSRQQRVAPSRWTDQTDRVNPNFGVMMTRVSSTFMALHGPDVPFMGIAVTKGNEKPE